MEMSPWCPPSCCWRLQSLPPKQLARLPKSWDLFGTSESPGTIIHENTRHIHIPRWKSPIAWENSWHAITLLCAWIQIGQDILLMMWGYMSSLWCSLHWYETTHYHVGQPFVPELRIPSKGTSNTSHLLSPWPLAAACSLFQDIQWWIPITFLTHFAIQSGPTRKTTQNGQESMAIHMSCSLCHK